MKQDFENIRNEYEERLDKFDFLVEQVKYLLNKAIDRKKIKIHSVVPRIKKLNSFLDKIRRKNVKDPFNEIHDLVGFRVICLFLPDLELVGGIIQNEFNVFEVDNKVNGTEKDIFGYMSVQYKAKLKNPINLPRYKNIENYPFEIQTRTIAQDAWASISHHLDYKQENFLPDSLRRDFYALSGLFYVADTHFSILRQEQSKFFVERSFKTKSDSTTNG